MDKIELVLKRLAKKKDYTIGHLYVNGKRFCDTLENTDRGLDQSMPSDELMKKKDPWEDGDTYRNLSDHHES